MVAVAGAVPAGVPVVGPVQAKAAPGTPEVPVSVAVAAEQVMVGLPLAVTSGAMVLVATLITEAVLQLPTEAVTV